MMLAGVDHVGLEVANLQRAEIFYTEILGFSLVMRLPDQILVRCGGQNIALFLKPDRPQLSSEEKQQLLSHPLGKAHISFRASWDSYQKFKEIFKEYEVASRDPMNWGDHEGYYFLDPDGNLLEIAGYKPPKK